MIDLEEIGEKVKGWFELDKILDSAPGLIGGIAILFLADKALDLGTKLKPAVQWVKHNFNRDDFKEFIDSVGDNLQGIDKLLQLFGVKIPEDWLKKIADFLQNVATAAKWIPNLLGGLQKLGSGVSGSKRLTHREI